MEDWKLVLFISEIDLNQNNNCILKILKINGLQNFTIEVRFKEKIINRELILNQSYFTILNDTTFDFSFI
jgi:hypothetical protein